MSTDVNIPKTGALDFLSLGALVHRLDPGLIPFRKAHECQFHVSGGEFNVAANLSDCFRLQTGVATARPLDVLEDTAAVVHRRDTEVFPRLFDPRVAQLGDRELLFEERVFEIEPQHDV